MSQKPWFKVLNVFGNHEKTLEAGNLSAGIWIRMMSYTSTNRNDGFVSELHVSQIVPSEERGALQKLIDVGLVEIVQGGYNLTDYLLYNSSRAEIEKDDERDRKNGEKSGEVRKTKAAVASGVAHPLAAEHHKLYNKYPAKHGGTAFKKWMAYCAENITTPELAADLRIAIDLYREEKARSAKTDGKSIAEIAQYILAPHNFLLNEDDGSEHWRILLAANDTPLGEKKAEEKAPKPIARELLPWADKASDDESDKKRRAAAWPDSRIKEFIEERLTGKSEKYRERWLEAHELTRLFAPAVTS